MVILATATRVTTCTCFQGKSYPLALFRRKRESFTILVLIVCTYILFYAELDLVLFYLDPGSSLMACYKRRPNGILMKLLYCIDITRLLLEHTLQPTNQKLFTGEKKTKEL